MNLENILCDLTPVANSHAALTLIHVSAEPGGEYFPTML